MPSAIWNIYLGDEYGNRTAYFDTIVSGEFVRVVNDVGAFSITLPGDTSAVIQNPDGLVEIWRQPDGGIRPGTRPGLYRTIAGAAG